MPKLGKRRSCFLLHKYFVKIIFFQNVQERKVLSSTPRLGAFLTEKKVANCPRVLFQKNIFGIYTELCERVNGARSLSNEHEAFYSGIKEVLSEARERYDKISWRSLLNSETLKYIKSKPEIYQYIKDVLDNEYYPNTGMHGDLNPNNILIDPDQKFWIVDWETHSETGSIVWDTYWFYCNWKRSTPYKS